MRRVLLFLSLAAAAIDPARAAFSFQFDPRLRQRDLSNGTIRAVFRLDRDSHFTMVGLENLAAAQVWRAPNGQPSSPILLRMGGAPFDAASTYSLAAEFTEQPNASTVRQVIVLDDLGHRVQIRLELELYDGQPVLHHHVTVTNQQVKAEYVNAVDLAPYSFAADAQSYTLFRVAQWSVSPQPRDFQTGASTLDNTGKPITLVAGSGGDYCTCMAVRDENGRGLFLGWEFDGQSRARAKLDGAQAVLSLNAGMTGVFHRVDPGGSFDVPGGFIGVFQGDWDEAGYRTQRFVEAVLAKPAPVHFPYVSWDSWAYTDTIDEHTLRQKRPNRRHFGNRIVRRGSWVGARSRGLAGGSSQISERIGGAIGLRTLFGHEIRLALRFCRGDGGLAGFAGAPGLGYLGEP
jgi:alpha-galactosidase